MHVLSWPRDPPIGCFCVRHPHKIINQLRSLPRAEHTDGPSPALPSFHGAYGLSAPPVCQETGGLVSPPRLLFPGSPRARLALQRKAGTPAAPSSRRRLPGHLLQQPDWLLPRPAGARAPLGSLGSRARRVQRECMYPHPPLGR